MSNENGLQHEEATLEVIRTAARIVFGRLAKWSN